MTKSICWMCGKEIDKNEIGGKLVVEALAFDRKILYMEERVCKDCDKKIYKITIERGNYGD